MQLEWMELMRGINAHQMAQHQSIKLVNRSTLNNLITKTTENKKKPRNTEEIETLVIAHIISMMQNKINRKKKIERNEKNIYSICMAMD